MGKDDLCVSTYIGIRRGWHDVLAEILRWDSLPNSSPLSSPLDLKGEKLFAMAFTVNVY